MALDQATAALIGAAIGAVSGILGGYVTGLRQAKLEREKWSREREDSIHNDTRGVAAQLTKTLASGAHSMMWATYKALNARGVSEEALQNYEAELHQTIADLVSAQMLAATLRRELYENITPLVSEAIDLGSETYEALLSATKDMASAEATLLAANQKALAFIKHIPIKLAEMQRLMSANGTLARIS